MGCMSSAPDANREKIIANEDFVKANPSAVGDENLDKMRKCAQEIRFVFQILCTQGAKDRESLSRIEKVSDDVLGNLLSRLTPDEFKKGPSSYKPLVDSCLEIGKDLDAVRATKATDALRQHADRIIDGLDAVAGQGAAQHVAKIKAAKDKLKAASDLVPGANAILSLAEEAHEKAPDSKKVTEELLDAIVTLSVWMLKIEKTWSVDYPSCQTVTNIATRIDTIAAKLVVVMGANWDPPMLFQVEDRCKIAAETTCAALVKNANAMLAANNAGGAYDSLKALFGWWPMLKDTTAHTLEVTGLFSKMQTHASEAFQKATIAGDTGSSDAIRGFADQFDELRKSFDGLPPPREGAGLGEVLGAAETKALVIKAIGALDTEVAKTTDDDKSSNLSLGNTIQAMETLVANWEQARAGDEDLADKLDASCASLEQWTEKTADAQKDATKIGALVKFAEEYDSRREKLVPPAPKDGALRPRIASRAAGFYLKGVDAELAKLAGAGLNPVKLLEALKLAAEAVPGETGTPEVRARILAAFVGVDDRLLSAFTETVTASSANEKKEVMLLKFAAQADEIRITCAFVQLGDSTLVQRLESKRAGVATELISTIEANAQSLRAGAAAFMEFAPLLESLTSLQSALGKSPVSEDLQERLRKVFADLGEKLVESCGRAASDQSLKAVDEFIRVARGMDGVVAAVKLEPLNFQKSIIGLGVVAHLAAAEQALSAADPPDCAVLCRELAAVEDLCIKERCTEDITKQVSTLIEALEKPLIDKMMRVDAAAAHFVVEVAVAADKARGAAEGHEPSGDLSGKVSGLQAVSGKLREAKAELGKSAGMNPNTVNKILKELEPVWGPVKDLEGCRASLVEVASLLSGKMAEATKKGLAVAEEAERAKKVQAVNTIALEADKSLAALAALSKGMEVSTIHCAVSRAVVDHHIATVDAELAKETGRNSALMLSSSVGLAKVWPEMGGAGGAGAASDEVVELEGRWKATHSKVKEKMQEAMDDAVKTANEKKKQALLTWATDFDKAVGSFSDGLLAEELKAKMES